MWQPNWDTPCANRVHDNKRKELRLVVQREGQEREKACKAPQGGIAKSDGSLNFVGTASEKGKKRNGK